MAGEAALVILRLFRLDRPSALAEAAPLHQGEDDGGLAGARAARHHHPRRDRQVRRQLVQHLAEQPGAAHQGGGGGARHLEVERLQEGGLGDLRRGVRRLPWTTWQ